MLAQGTVIAGRFQLVRVLGSGGMGAVWLAHHIGLDTPCAVKFIHPEVAMQGPTRERFAREAKVVAQLRSPHVVQVLDHGEWEGLPYIAMEYLEGEDLGSRLKRVGRLSAYETVALVSQVARALTKAHAAGLVHRDLKPENIFLIRDEDSELVKVLDFGIAKSMAGPLQGGTATGALLGTPSYMSPEQAQGTKTVDFRSDLWSLAVVAFRCLTGRLPFVSEALGDLLVQIIVGALPVPSQVAPGVPPRFDAWWERAAARDPQARYQSARELSESLAMALNVTSSYGMRGPSQPDASGLMPAPAGSRPSLEAPVASPAYASMGPAITGGVAVRATTPPLEPTTHDPNLHAPPLGTVPGVARTFADAPPHPQRTGLFVAMGGGMVLVGVVAALLIFGLRDPAPTEAGRTVQSGSAVAAPPEASEPAAAPAQPPSAAPSAEAKAKTEPSAAPSAKPAAQPAQPAAKPSATPAASKPATPPATPPPPATPARPASTYDPGI